MKRPGGSERVPDFSLSSFVCGSAAAQGRRASLALFGRATCEVCDPLTPVSTPPSLGPSRQTPPFRLARHCVLFSAARLLVAACLCPAATHHALTTILHPAHHTTPTLSPSTFASSLSLSHPHSFNSTLHTHRRQRRFNPTPHASSTAHASTHPLSRSFPA